MDEIHKHIHRYLSSSTYPSHFTKDDKRKLRARSKRYEPKAEKLYWKNNNGEFREVVFTENEQKSLLKAFHDERGHLGRERTYQVLSDTYYWKNLFDDVCEYVASCEKCQMTSNFIKSPEELHPIPVISPWFHVGMDLIKMPVSKSGKNYILTVVDYFSKWPEAVPLPDKSSETVASALLKIFLRMGFPTVFSSDQGREFVNATMDALKNRTGAVHKISSAYHPQTNGLTERFNRTLQEMLIKVCSDDQTDWDGFLDEVLFSYRVGKQKATKMSPFEIIFARNPVREMGSSPLQEIIDDGEIIKTVEEMQKLRHIIENKVKSNIKNSQEDQVKRHKRIMTETRIQVGDKVLRYNARKVSRKGSKMETNWLGPYIVHNINEKGVTTLVNERNQKLASKYNVKHLKLFRERNTDNENVCDSTECKMESVSESPQFFNPIDAQWQEEANGNLKLKIAKKHRKGEPKPLTKPKNVINIKGDGNCYFRSISFALTGSEKNHEKIRDRIVSFMTENSSCVEKHFGSTYLDDSQMQNSGTWATDAEILATAAYLNADIFVYAHSGKDYKWLKYSKELLRLPRSMELNEKAIYIQNINGNHFDYVEDVE
jgi:hypothetical protein